MRVAVVIIQNWVCIFLQILVNLFRNIGSSQSLSCYLNTELNNRVAVIKMYILIYCVIYLT